MIIAGTARYTISGIQGNRILGLMVYNDTANSWSIVNDFAPELLFPMYFYNIPSEDYDWAGGHVGGNPSFIKKDGKCYLFTAFLLSSNTYQMAVVSLVRNTQSTILTTSKDIPGWITDAEYNDIEFKRSLFEY